MPLIASTGRENQRRAVRPLIPIGDVYGLAVLDSRHTFGPVLPRETRVFDHESGKSRAKSSRVVASSLNSAFLDFMLHGSLMLSPSFQTLEVLPCRFIPRMPRKGLAVGQDSPDRPARCCCKHRSKTSSGRAQSRIPPTVPCNGGHRAGCRRS